MYVLRTYCEWVEMHKDVGRPAQRRWEGGLKRPALLEERCLQSPWIEMQGCCETSSEMRRLEETSSIGGEVFTETFLYWH